MVFKSMNNVKSQLDAQMDQIMDGLDGARKASRRCHFFVPKIQEAELLKLRVEQSILMLKSSLGLLRGTALLFQLLALL